MFRFLGLDCGRFVQIVEDVAGERPEDGDQPVEGEVVEEAVALTASHQQGGQGRVEHGARYFHPEDNHGQDDEANDDTSEDFIAVVVWKEGVVDDHPGEEGEEEGAGVLHHDDVEGGLVSPGDDTDAGRDGRSPVLVVARYLCVPDTRHQSRQIADISLTICCSHTSPVTHKTAEQHGRDSAQTLAGALQDVGQSVGTEAFPASNLPGDHQDEGEAPHQEALSLHEDALLQGHTAQLQGAQAAQQDILEGLTDHTGPLDGPPRTVQQVNEDQDDGHRWKHDSDITGKCSWGIKTN